MRKALKVLAAGAVASFFPLLAGGIWAGLITLNLRTTPRVPWSAALMGAILFAAWRFAKKREWPLRAVAVRPPVFAWSMLAGILAIAALAGFWIDMFALVPMPPNVLPDSSGVPWLTMAILVAMGSLVSPLTEEGGFRGFYQSMLEREFRAPIAIAISSSVFALGHLNHGVLWPKQLAYFLGGVMLGTIAYLAKSILPAIAVHILADLTFFAFVWPFDAARRTVWTAGPDTWFWLHIAQFLGFGALAVLAYRKLAAVAQGVTIHRIQPAAAVDLSDGERRSFAP